MAVEVRVPRLGWSMEEGTLTQWLKKEGDYVRKGDLLFVLEGEKATQDIESFDEGVLRFLPSGPQPGDAVRVGQVVAILLAEGEQPPLASAPAERLPAQRAVDPHRPRAVDRPPKVEHFPAVQPPAAAFRLAPAAGPAARRLARQLGVKLPEVSGSGAAGRILMDDVRSQAAPASDPSTRRPHASPRARRRAAELGIDWHGIVGTGSGGRVRERDVLALAGAQQGGHAAERRTAPSTIRRTIAQRMLDSHLTTAPVTLTTEVDATNLVTLREQFRAAQASPATSLPSYTDFLLKLTALALLEHPALNVRCEGDQVVESSAVHLGIAVDTSFGLLVPVVRDVERLSLRELASQTKLLAAQAQARRLSVEQMQGGTFTVTNLGVYGIDAFTPIIHDHQAAILGIGRIRKQPAVVDGQVVPRDLLTLSLTFDHRLIDGAPAARFLQTLSAAVENPAVRLIG